MATKTERRNLARLARKQLGLYLTFLEAYIEQEYAPEQLTSRKDYCLQEASQALDKLLNLENSTGS